MHLLGERQIAQQAGEDVGQRVNGAAATLVLLIGEVFALGRFRARQLLERHALLLGKTERRRGRLAVLPEGRRHGRAGDRLVEVVLAFRDVRHPHGQAAGRAETLDRRPRRDPGLFEARLEPLGELPGQTRHPRGGQLFDADFDQKFSIHQCSRSRRISDHDLRHDGHDGTMLTMKTTRNKKHRVHRVIVLIVNRLCRRRISLRLLVLIVAHPCLGDRDRQLAHAQDVGHALGDADARRSRRAG